MGTIVETKNAECKVSGCMLERADGRLKPTFFPAGAVHPLVGATGCFFSGINEVPPKEVKYD